MVQLPAVKRRTFLVDSRRRVRRRYHRPIDEHFVQTASIRLYNRVRPPAGVHFANMQRENICAFLQRVFAV